jgi:hypothetical protein
MLNFFKYLNNIFFTKNKSFVGKENCSDPISGFMMNRWASFLDKKACLKVNETCNKQILTEDFDLLSKYLFLFLEKRPYKKIDYINKNKDKSENVNEALCKNMQMGTRDLQLYIKTLNEKEKEELLQIYKG